MLSPSCGTAGPCFLLEKNLATEKRCGLSFGWLGGGMLSRAQSPSGVIVLNEWTC